MSIVSPLGEEFGFQDTFLNSSSPAVNKSNKSSDEAKYNGDSASNEQFEFIKPIPGKWIIRIHHDGGLETTTFKVKSNNYYIIGLPEQITGTSTTTTQIVKKPDLTLQVGPNEGHDFVIDLTDARTSALGIDKVDLSTREKAEEAIRIIDSAMKHISMERSKYGAYMNTLEHIQNNLGNAQEMLTKAESGIRDSDMAKEMMKLQKDQVLLQSSQSLSAQINQMGQGILQLLS